MFLKGSDGVNGLVGIRFTSQAKEGIPRGGEPTAALLFNGVHGLVVLDGVSLELSHTISTVGVQS